MRKRAPSRAREPSQPEAEEFEERGSAEPIRGSKSAQGSSSQSSRQNREERSYERNARDAWAFRESEDLSEAPGSAFAAVAVRVDELIGALAGPQRDSSPQSVSSPYVEADDVTVPGNSAEDVLELAARVSKLETLAPNLQEHEEEEPDGANKMMTAYAALLLDSLQQYKNSDVKQREPLSSDTLMRFDMPLRGPAENKAVSTPVAWAQQTLIEGLSKEGLE
eukprot:Skav205729  [mRNA]  locus=scaffold1496:120813:128646:+ [translate_table: standard]